ncbi:D-aminoacyl-tRNA deacylase [Proteocatella sphenisci]|uniref:D-aminoacyl-tRNA deacylase n=1 Tax=Proteocatella sphenisci TaxID=181070 RepID=UPI00048AA5A1|nr:D-aminoacyl-tRNA deacylase [Proteocatella sphenisci]
MRAIIQRVKYSSVEFIRNDEKIKNEISKGLQVLVGITHDDTSKDVEYIVDKITGLRIFEDENHKMNLSINDISGEILLVSQFTLYGDARKGKRPSFSDAAKPDLAIPLYESMIDNIKDKGIVCKTGEFGADMDVTIINDGPVTIMLDSKKQF